MLGFIVPVLLLVAHLPAAGWQRGMTQAAVNSIGLAVAAALCAAALGLVLALLPRDMGARAQLFVVRLAALGYAVPGTVLALGIMTA